MMALEEALQITVDEAKFAAAATVADFEAMARPLEGTAGSATGGAAASTSDPIDFPTWNRTAPARALRRVSLPTWILPLARVFATIKVEGLEHLAELDGPAIFAANHQSHFDTPAILAALPPRWRYRLAPAMAKEFFKAHFYPDQFGRARLCDQQPELLSGVAVLQRVPAAAAGSGHPADAALHRCAAVVRVLGADLPGGQAHRTTARSCGFSQASGWRRPACRCRWCRSGSRVLTVSCTRHGSSLAAGPQEWCSGVLCGWRARTTRRWLPAWKTPCAAVMKPSIYNAEFAEGCPNMAQSLIERIAIEQG